MVCVEYLSLWNVFLMWVCIVFGFIVSVCVICLLFVLWEIVCRMLIFCVDRCGLVFDVCGVMCWGIGVLFVMSVVIMLLYSWL